MDLLDILIILAKQKRFIIKTILLFILLATIYAFFATPIYKSTLTFMPPIPQQSSQSSSILAALGGGLEDVAVSLLGISAPSDLIVGLAQSRVVVDSAIDKTGFAAHWSPGFLKKMIMGIQRFLGFASRPPLRVTVRERFMEMLDVVSNPKSGIIALSFSDVSPDFAAKVATAMFDELRDYMQNQLISQTTAQRMFLEAQLKEVLPLLAEAEQKLTAYQTKTGILDVTAQGSALMTEMAELRARVAIKEVELRAAQQSGTARNPEVRRIQAELAEMRKQLQKLESASGRLAPSEVGLQDIPDAALEYMRLMRDFQFQETVYNMLLKQYESARILEAQEPLIIQLVSPAEVPEKRDSPKRKLIISLAGVLGLFWALIGTLIRHSLADSSLAVKKLRLRELLRMKSSRK